MTALVTRGYILAGELPQAKEVYLLYFTLVIVDDTVTMVTNLSQVLHTLQGQEGAEHLVCALQGEMFLSMEDWDNAIKQ